MLGQVHSFYEGIYETHSSTDSKPGFMKSLHPTILSEEPQDFKEIAQTFEKSFLPHINNWQSPMFYAFFPCNHNPATSIADSCANGLSLNDESIYKEIDRQVL